MKIQKAREETMTGGEDQEADMQQMEDTQVDWSKFKFEEEYVDGDDDRPLGGSSRHSVQTDS